MSKTPDRTYNSPIRKQQADATRQRVVENARALLVEHGFEGVTIETIAKRAGVSVPTVYSLFGSKAGIVRAILDSARFGSAYQQKLSKIDFAKSPKERLRAVAGIARKIYESEREVLELISGAGAVSQQLSDLSREREDERYERQAGTLKWLKDLGVLRRDLDLTRARDVLWTMTARDLYRSLVVERGWSGPRYEVWLGSTLAAALLHVPKSKH